MRFRKPDLIPTLFIICAEIVLIGMGVWQLERLAWKENLIATIEKAQAEPALTKLPKDTAGLDYRSVNLKGSFLNDKSGKPFIFQRVGNRHGEKPGFNVISPFVLANDGRTILVNRGFAPTEKIPELKTPHTLTIIGVIRPAHGKRAFFIPDNQPEKNVWLYEDIAAMSATTKLELLPLIVEATGNYEKGVYPIPSDGKIVLRNDHLGYAITWFSLAIAGLVLFGIYYRERRSASL